MPKQQESKPTIVRNLFKRSLRIAAAAILIIGIATIYEYSTFTSSKIFSSTFEPYSAPTMRDASKIPAIQKMYNGDNNEEVIALFDHQQNHSPEDYFFCGNAYLKLHKPADAIKLFEELLSQNNRSNSHKYQEDAEYYLALSYIDNNEIQKAIPLLEKIHADKNHGYHDKVSSWLLFKLRWAH